MSEISRLSEEDTRLQASLLEKTAELHQVQQQFVQQISELKESRQHDINTAVEDALIGRVTEIKTITENFDQQMQEIKATQQSEIQQAVSKIAAEHQHDYIQSQGQAIEFKTSINSMLAMSKQIDTVVQRAIPTMNN